MATARHRTAMRAGVILFLVLTLVPLAFAGHHHQDPTGTKDTCAACFATRYTPAVSVPLHAQLPPPRECLALALHHVIAPVRAHQSPKTGRAPPSLSVTRAA